MSHCPSCGRYVGPHGACPFCGARMTGRMPIRVVKLAAIILATVGLAVLWFVATRAEVPTVPIGQVGATMNLAYVRVEGRCIRTPSYDPSTGYLSFWVADDTGELHVVSYREETEALIDEGNVPALGDRVAVAGTLRVQEDFRSLTVNAPGEVNIVRAAPEACSLRPVALDPAYRRVRVRGQVRRVIEPYPGLRLIALRDETGTLDVAVSDDLVALSRAAPSVTIGQSVEVVAVVSPYEGRAQLVPASVADIVPLQDDVPIAAKRFVSELSPEGAGAWVALRGIVAALNPFSEGVKLTLDDGTGAVTVLLWQNVYEALRDKLGDGSQLGPGAEIEAQGELAEYRGELEVIPELAADVRLLAGAGAADMGGSVVPQGTLGQTETPLPTRTPRRSATPRPIETLRLRDIVPSRPTPTTAPEPTTTITPMPGTTPAPKAELTSIGAITPDRVGEEVTLEGVVVDAGSFSRGFKLTLDDGQGRVVLLIWHDVYDDCWDGARINLGARVRARGEISQYEGQLQIEPRFGGDVKVIQPAVAQAPRREIGSISADDEGQRVMIEGEVVRVEGLPSAVKVLLKDEEAGGQGDIMVFIWRNVLDRIADNTGLGTPGSRVCVVGRVQIYQSNLEIVPALPNDVTVLKIP